VGVNVVGWLDPLSFFFRRNGGGRLPRAESAPRIRSWSTNSLRRHWLAVEQAALFRQRPDRVACIGVFAALDFTGRAFGAGMFVRSERCSESPARKPAGAAPQESGSLRQLPPVPGDCQGGPTWTHTLEWKPAECFYCFNCQSIAPQAVALNLSRPRARTWIWAAASFCLGVAGAGGRAPVPHHPLAGQRSYNPSWCPPGRAGRREFLSKCIPLRRVHESVPHQRHPPHGARSRPRGHVVAPDEDDHRLLRVRVYVVVPRSAPPAPSGPAEL